MTEPQPATRFATYLWSGETDSDLSGARQTIARHAETHGLTMAAEFCDRGIAGDVGLRGRPGLSELLLRVAIGGVDVVLLTTADQLSHDLVQREVVLHELRRAGVAVLAAGSGEDLTGGSDDAPAVLVRQVLHTMAELEGHAAITGLRRRAAADNPGSSLDRARVEIRRLRQQRISLTRIAQHLNELGLRDPAGQPWTRMAVFAVRC